MAKKKRKITTLNEVGEEEELKKQKTNSFNYEVELEKSIDQIRENRTTKNNKNVKKC